MKKILVLYLVICLTLVITIIPSYAADVDSFENPDTTVSSMYYQSTNAYLSISSSGMATAKGTITGYIGKTTKTTIHLYLQKYSGGKWTTVDDWIKTDNTVNLTLIKQIKVTKGYKYRVKASFYAYSGTKSESNIRYSPTVTY